MWIFVVPARKVKVASPSQGISTISAFGFRFRENVCYNLTKDEEIVGVKLA